MAVFAALAIVAAGVVVNASPAFAHYPHSFTFSGPGVGTGTVTFLSNNQVRVSSSVYAQAGQGVVWSAGYYQGNGSYACGGTHYHLNDYFGVQDHSSTATCTIANIQRVWIRYAIPGASEADWDFIYNPHTTG